LLKNFLRQIAANPLAKKQAILLFGKISAFGALVFPLIAGTVSLLLISLIGILANVSFDTILQDIAGGFLATGFIVLFGIGPAIFLAYIVASIPGLVSCWVFMLIAYLGHSKQMDPKAVKMGNSIIGAIVGAIIIALYFSLEPTGKADNWLWISCGLLCGAIAGYVSTSITLRDAGSIQKVLSAG
jgi:hypothetical protein